MRIGLLASVGHMVDSFFPEIIETWTAAGHSVSVAAGTPTADGDSVVISGLGRRPGPGAVTAWAGLRRWVRSERLDVVVTNSATASALVRTARLEVPVVYFCHGLHWNTGTELGDRVWQQVEHALLRRTAGVIAINSDDHAWFGQRFDPQRLLRLRSGVGLDLERYRYGEPLPQSADDRLELVWIGEFSARKRPNLALDVVLGLESRGVDVHLRMIGDGDLRSATRERIRRLGLSGRVTADGPGSVVDALTHSHGLLHTSAWEGLPRVMLEAVAVGRRAYAFDVKGVRDVPEAVLAADGDAGALAAAVHADWASGRMTAPLDFDRADLDYRLTGDAVRSFLEGLTDRRTAGQGVR
ncbi:glycosyltransferase [Brevibacterium casei]|uniref:glycosyltransferase n=1 Tax=Brevibacterium casei TaxID=33889 RepID=UPI00186B6E72|nr:glycosyltransferase [Brevibacterium casei]MBE4694408.1 glycosyltransferase [Brevibacterium casei]MBY3577530.1 glycosyltransferase family 4 protein [Brevibacterium casei]MCT1447532.1 glycosyltransferase [Brevibacterium casei]MCT2357595.1 glycosyltransferase [Brevibacterium casei]MDH5148381.1 glycosyltransferase [Brevibacterium casei]